MFSALQSVILHPLLLNTFLLFPCNVSLPIVKGHLTLHILQLQYFVLSSISMNISQGMYEDLGTAVVDRCYNYVQLHYSHLCRTYTHKHKKLSFDQDKVAVTVCSPLCLFQSLIIPFPLLEYLSFCQVNWKLAEKLIRKYLFPL